MMHPTLHDHVLECALFQQTMPDGRVAILTDDTTLKIKALAEVMFNLHLPTRFYKMSGSGPCTFSHMFMLIVVHLKHQRYSSHYWFNVEASGYPLLEFF